MERVVSFYSHMREAVFLCIQNITPKLNRAKTRNAISTCSHTLLYSFSKCTVGYFIDLDIVISLVTSFIRRCYSNSCGDKQNTKKMRIHHEQRNGLNDLSAHLHFFLYPPNVGTLIHQHSLDSYSRNNLLIWNVFKLVLFLF